MKFCRVQPFELVPRVIANNRNLIVDVLLRFENAITTARKIIFPFRKKFLVAEILLYNKKQLQSEIDLRPPRPP